MTKVVKNKSQKKTHSDTNTESALKTLIHDHAQFFDELVNLIPKQFYLPVDEDSKPYFQGLSKAKKAAQKKQTRENIKKSRRDRLKSQATTIELLKKNIIDKEKDNQDSDDDEDDDDDDEEEEIEINVKPSKRLKGETSNDNSNANNKSVTYEELQQRLHQKLEMLRSNRGQGKRTMIMNEVRKRDNYTDKKRKRENVDNSKAAGGASSSGTKDKVDADFEFGKVKLGDEDGNKKKVKKGSKVKELEKAKKLKEAKMENAEVATKHSWKAATEKAMGVKVHDDPKLLKKSLQKDKKRREKSAGKWKERVETQDKLREEKQAKRKENIEGRANQKKMRKIAKREKKLMRPGFEGRKEGYIGDK